MDLTRFLELPTTSDGRRVVTLLADPSMTDAAGQPAGFLSLVDKGANLRRFQVVKAEDLDSAQLETYGKDPSARSMWGRFLSALGLGHLAAKSEDPAPLTFDAAMTAERLRRARWEATDALWEVIGNVLRSELEDKPGAVRLALGQFSATVMGLVEATTAMKAEDAPTVLAALEPPSEVVAKAGRMISARNMGTLEATRDAMAKALSQLESLIAAASPSPSKASKAETAPDTEDPSMLTPDQIAAHAEAAAASAVKAAKSAGLTDPAVLAQVAVEASTTVHKAAVAGYPAPAMPSDTLASQMAQGKGGKGGGKDPHAMLTAVLGQVSSLSTKLDGVVTKVDAMDAALNGSGEGDAREPGALELASKAAELAHATATKVSKIETTPAAPRGGSDPERPVVAKRDGQDADVYAGSALSFTAGKPTG